jgi:hypothetical protein
MKYLITESQIDDLITKQLNTMFDVSNINSTHPYEYNDETGEEYEDNERIEFYFGDFGDEETVFQWYGKGYWGDNQNDYRGYKTKSPIVDIEEPYQSNLNNLFGNKWYKPFKVWFEKNFEVPVKSIMDEVYD